MEYELGDIETLTLASDEEIEEGKVFRSAGRAIGQEAIYWEVQEVGVNGTYVCKVVGINAYMRTIM